MKQTPTPPLFPSGRTGFLLALLALGAALLRWLLRTPVVYNWDSVHYVLAQDHYSILAHQPHPPGSFYYVMLARALRSLAGDGHAALLWVSSLSGALLVAVLFLLARLLARGAGEDRAAWLAAVLGATAPLFGFYGAVGLSYGPAGALAALFALGCVLQLRGVHGGMGALLAGAALGLLGGFRPTDAAFLLPAYAWAQWSDWRRGAHVGVGAGLGAWVLLTAGWLLPNVFSAGGWSGYLAANRAQEQLFGRSSVFLAGWPALEDTLLTHRRVLESSLGVAWLLVVALAFRYVRRDRAAKGNGDVASPEGSSQAAAGRDQAIFSALVVLPAALFFLLGHFNSPGYALVYAGLGVAWLGVALAPALPRGGVPLGAALGLIAAGNLALFVLGWPGVGRAAQRSLSYAELRDHHRYYAELRAFLRTQRLVPGSVRILASWNSTDGLRVVQTLLPEYAADTAQAVEYVPDLPPVMARLGFLRFVTPEEVLSGGRPAYLVVRTREDPAYHRSLFRERWDRVPIGPGHEVYRLRGPAPAVSSALPPASEPQVP